MTDAASPDTACRLPRLGVLAVDGPDAATFLQGQATCDARQVSAQRGALGALCNLQGRMIVSFLVLAVPDGLRLVMPRDRVAAILTHLKKYAVFSKVTLRDDSDAFAVLGGRGTHADADAFTVGGDGTLQLRGGRTLRLCAVADADAHGNDDTPWHAAALRAGEVLVDSVNADRHLPQALNYDVIDGVNFRKGCYTGQEVVARMHFKGKMKERLQLFRSSGAAPAAGGAVTDAAGQSVGSIVDVAGDGDETLVAAVVRHDALDGRSLRAGEAALSRLTLPYAVPDAPASP